MPDITQALQAAAPTAPDENHPYRTTANLSHVLLRPRRGWSQSRFAIPHERQAGAAKNALPAWIGDSGFG